MSAWQGMPFLTGAVGEQTVEVEFIDPGVETFAFTFGKAPDWKSETFSHLKRPTSRNNP